MFPTSGDITLQHLALENHQAILPDLVLNRTEQKVQLSSLDQIRKDSQW